MPRNYDDSSVDLGIEFQNRSNCKVDIDGTILRGDQAVAVVDWGLVELDPREQRKGHREVSGLRDMQPAEGLKACIYRSS